jgi:5-methylcytosine-specific restriction protein A
MLPRPCLVDGCPGITTAGRSRCSAHENQMNAAKRRRRAAAPGDGAAARLRRTLNIFGVGTCAVCSVRLPAHLLDVDHLVPLIDGGGDYDHNVRPICRSCHREKTANEARARRRTS